MKAYANMAGLFTSLREKRVLLLFLVVGYSSKRSSAGSDPEQTCENFETFNINGPKDLEKLENFIAEQSKKGNIVSIETTVNEVTDAPHPTSSSSSPTCEATTATAPLSMRCGNKPWEPAKSLNETGGVVDIDIPGLGKKEVYCDMRTDDGGWIVFQRRMDGSEDFYRDWIDYVNGFGERNKEFWLGLEAIHQLTKDGNHELRIDMIERNGTHYFAKYSSFQVGPSTNNYKLTVDGYSGNATDSFQYQNNQSFSAMGKDNDASSHNCVHQHRGGWWYNECHRCNLNGLFDEVTNWYGVSWKDRRTKSWMFMKFTEMKLRPIK